MADLSWFVMTVGNLVFLWATPVLQLALLAVFLYRSIFLFKFPAFFRYTCFAVVANVVQISVLHNRVWYFWIYWIDQMIYGVLALLVMREVFQIAWDMKHGVRRFLVWALILIFGAAAALWGSHHSDKIRPLASFAAGFSLFMAGVHVSEVVLFGLAVRLIRKLTRYHLGIMLGFAISASAQALAYMGKSFHFGPVLKEIVDYAPLSAYLASAGIWLSTFLSKPKLTTAFDPDEAMEWMSRQESVAREMSTRLGLKWPGKKKDLKNLEYQPCVKGSI
jgi:hypothetical protein